MSSLRTVPTRKSRIKIAVYTASLRPLFNEMYFPIHQTATLHRSILTRSTLISANTVIPEMNNETRSVSLLTLLGEIHNAIIACLGPLGSLLLRGTCRYFRRIIPPPGLGDLLLAESDQFAAERNVYACSLCISLRHARHFIYTMTKRNKRRGGYGARNRFCINCGLKPPRGQSVYAPGTIVRTESDVFVMCQRCEQFKPTSQKTPHKGSVSCKDYWKSECEKNIRRNIRIMRHRESSEVTQSEEEAGHQRSGGYGGALYHGDQRHPRMRLICRATKLPIKWLPGLSNQAATGATYQVVGLATRVQSAKVRIANQPERWVVLFGVCMTQGHHSRFTEQGIQEFHRL